MKKAFKISLIIIGFLVLLIGLGYAFFIYEKPVDQGVLAKFMEGQPIIDMHFHITKGYVDNEQYNKLNSNIDLAKLQWVKDDYAQNNVVLALGGGNEKYAQLYAESDLFWAGLIFPWSNLVEQDQPCETEFSSEKALREYYESGLFKSMGESMYNYHGIPPSDPRLDPYWKIAEEYVIPVGIHSDTGPPSVDEKERPHYAPEYANPELLKPILEKYPRLKIYLMHYGGSYSDEAIELMHMYPQIHYEISAVSLFMPKIIWESSVKKLYVEGLGDRLMFASDYFGTVKENIEIIYSMDWLTEEQKRDVFYNNAARFLELSPEQIQEHHEMVRQ
ncbi:amidohydrolase family protein [Cyclobacterium salsum]|uniref:amidohydrolase family protein n=1 Tax=Cyclobacterium salsum TaxID=2666329 RepID=UPI001390AC5A|nr:amidohydrolase family protein [Cyclobacterium salsum]